MITRVAIIIVILIGAVGFFMAVRSSEKIAAQPTITDKPSSGFKIAVPNSVTFSGETRQNKVFLGTGEALENIRNLFKGSLPIKTFPDKIGDLSSRESRLGFVPGEKPEDNEVSEDFLLKISGQPIPSQLRLLITPAISFNDWRDKLIQARLITKDEFRNLNDASDSLRLARLILDYRVRNSELAASEAEALRAFLKTLY